MPAAGSLARQELDGAHGLPGLAGLQPGSSPTSAAVYPPLYLMVEASWLAYEEAPVVYHVLTDASLGWGVDKGRAIILDFVSITYSEAGEWMLPTAVCVSHGTSCDTSSKLIMSRDLGWTM